MKPLRASDLVEFAALVGALSPAQIRQVLKELERLEGGK